MSHGDSSYFMNADALIETARLINQDRLVTAAVSLLPPEIDGNTLHDVLDIGCGPGVWLLDLVAQYPHIRGIGIDNSKSMLDMARLLQKAEGKSFTIQHMDVRNGLAFPDASFDFIQMRLNHSFLLPPMWPPILKECYRVLRPGGSLCVIDLEAIFTNKPASEEYYGLLPAVWSKAHLGFSISGRSIGILAQTKPLLRQAGFVNARLELHALDVSKGEENYTLSQENLKIIFAGVLPTLIHKGGYTQEYLLELAGRAEKEMQEDDFSCVAVLFSVWCRKP
ncbi:MAG TPA: methyltransferase domain-containing protein [Ktedonobacteraceae bacterium]|nr:methyltransferase domain-containing protein [Ktedonobacteraceae bacterium]